MPDGTLILLDAPVAGTEGDGANGGAGANAVADDPTAQAV